MSMIRLFGIPRWSHRAVCGAVIAWLALAPGAQPAPAPRDTSFTDRGEGRELVADLLTRVPASNSEVLGLLKLRSPGSAILEVPIKMVVNAREKAWEDTYETQPVGDRPGEILVIRHQGLNPSQYFYARYRDRNSPPQLMPIQGDQLFQPLAGSDFYLADLGLHFLHWPSQKIVKKEMRKGRSCRVLESINPKPVPGTYLRVLSWIDFETGNLIMAEAYDLNDKLLKEFSIRKISRSEGKAQLKEIEMRNDQTESRTRLEFNLEIPDDSLP
jgi:hypothetical protein